MDILNIDFETFYSQKFSLSKMTTEEYIRDPQFETIGVAVKRNNEPTEWFSGSKAQTKRWLDKWDWANSVAVAHNAMFDMAILNWCYDIRPKRIADTLSMLRAIDGPHAGNSLAKLSSVMVWARRAQRLSTRWVSGVWTSLTKSWNGTATTALTT